MFAVIKTGGKQYRVAPGDVIVVEKLLGDTGSKIKLDQVLLVGEGDREFEIGTPFVSDAVVNCEVLEHSRSKKIIVFKKKRRQGYKRKRGHHQKRTVLRVIDINGKGAVKTESKKRKVESAKTADKAEAKVTNTGPSTKPKSKAKAEVLTKKKATVSKQSGKKRVPAKKKVVAKKVSTKKVTAKKT